MISANYLLTEKPREFNPEITHGFEDTYAWMFAKYIVLDYAMEIATKKLESVHEDERYFDNGEARAIAELLYQQRHEMEEIIGSVSDIFAKFIAKGVVSVTGSEHDKKYPQMASPNHSAQDLLSSGDGQAIQEPELVVAE